MKDGDRSDQFEDNFEGRVCEVPDTNIRYMIFFMYLTFENLKNNIHGNQVHITNVYSPLKRMPKVCRPCV